MVRSLGEGVGLLTKILRAVITEDSTEEPEEIQTTPSVDKNAEPMKAYWEKDETELANNNQAFIDQFLNDVSLDRIPDTTQEPVKESQYRFDSLIRLPPALKDFNLRGAPEPPKSGTGISSDGRDAGVVAGIVVAVITGVIILIAVVAVVMYRHYVHRNVTSMNFDNPVYRKTTEDQFAIEKNGYAPGSKLYPSTVGEEAQEPLNTPGTNDFV